MSEPDVAPKPDVSDTEVTMPEWSYFEDREQMVEFRKKPGVLQFRPIHREDPKSYDDVYANALLRADGTWAYVPEHLLSRVPEF